MREISSSSGKIDNDLQVERVKVQPKTDKKVEVPSPETVVPSREDKGDIETETSKKTGTPSLRFVDSPGRVAVKPSRVSNIETKKVLQIRISPENIQHGRVVIKGNIPASIVLNQVVRLGNEYLKAQQHVQRQAVLFEKASDTNTKAKDFSSQEKQEMWDEHKIKVVEGDNGDAKYIYYGDENGSPRELSNDELVEIYSHLKNMQDDEQLLLEAMDAGQRIREEIENSNSSNEEEPEEEIEIDQELEFVTEENTNLAAYPLSIYDDQMFNDNNENDIYGTNYINQADERRKEEALVHEKRMQQIHEQRFQKLRESVNEKVEKRVEDISKESKRIELGNDN